MSSIHGFEIYNNNKLLFSTVDSTWTVLLSVVIPRDTTAEYTIPNFSQTAVQRNVIGELGLTKDIYVHQYEWIHESNAKPTKIKFTVPEVGKTTDTHVTILGR